MKKLKISVLFLIISMLMFSLLGCQSEKKESKQLNEITIEITTDNGKNEIAKEKVKIKDGENLFNVMKEKFNTKDEKGMITSINNKKQENKKYWMFNVNNEPAMKGAKEIELKDGDKISWDLHEIK
ncbi:hypothetical protein COJ88_18565 [Bacillus cereus]|uniref:DUF4430 domain-containing protein n=1 Tax=Bacillus cereus TaxID=1396 RepID=UPI000BF4F59B|nr:DUF4430 domain-containing protein [Bacillus cereus]PFO94153.1 hypothetical protein COJ88_18565 [Bacillus cereus]PFO99874.1 hypothetical protein COJ97_15260 [Bacillus cereus]PGL48971.1 hypothetical protein CN922_19405 [Bacillus cereus]